MAPPQARYWLLTLPQAQHPAQPRLNVDEGTVYLKGQLEVGVHTGLVHWQLLVVFDKKVRLATVVRAYPGCHAEPSRSDAANAYVWKEETRVPGTQFEIGNPDGRWLKLMVLIQ